MKSKFFILGCTALMVAGIFYSCSKDQPAADEQNNTVQITDADRAVAGRILEFRHKLELKKNNPTLKSSEIIAIDDARFDVETNFNATYGFPDEKYEKTSTESTLVYLPVVDNNSTTINDMLALYDECLNKVLEIYNSSTLENKELLFINLKKGEIKGSQLQLYLNVVLGTKLTPGSYWEPFGESDNWKYGELLGKCDGSYFLESDAAKQIQGMLDIYRPIYWVSPPYRIVYSIDQASPYLLYGNEYQDADNNNLMFYIDKTTTLTDDDICLDYNEMNFHFNGHHSVIYDIMPTSNNKPSNWQCIGWEIEGWQRDYQDPSTGDHYRIRHESILTYAYRHVVMISEIEDPISLSTL